jgi:DNA invertase Pin-like site-specific DNA recombinase
MRIGYARVSTTDQNWDLQEDALQKAGCEKIFRDVASSAVDSRKGLAEAIDYARDGDTLVVWKLDRLGRSLKHLIETVGTYQSHRRLPLGSASTHHVAAAAGAPAGYL